MKKLHLSPIALFTSLVLGAGLFAVACGSSDDAAGPSDSPDTAVIPTDSAVKDTTPATDTAPAADTGPVADTGPAADTGGDSGGDTKPWDPDSGVCFPGSPTKDVEFLNACTTATCIKYDNKKLKHLKADGTLPALP